MGGFFGPIGGLIHVPFTSSESEEPGPRSAYRKALSGRITEQRGPRGRRKWDCSIDTSRPEDHQMLDQIEADLFGLGPHVWYSAMSRVTNILTPSQSMFREGTWAGGAQGGAGTASDDTPYARSYTSGLAEQMGLGSLVPIPGDVPVTASIYISTHPASPAMLYVDEVDPEGRLEGGVIQPSRALVDTHQASVAANQHAQRVAITFTPSVRTVALRIRVVGALMLTMPAVSFTFRPMDWSAGRGCLSASINLGSSDPRLAFESEDGWGRRESRTFTIHELG